MKTERHNKFIISAEQSNRSENASMTPDSEKRAPINNTLIENTQNELDLLSRNEEEGEQKAKLMVSDHDHSLRIGRTYSTTTEYISEDFDFSLSKNSMMSFVFNSYSYSPEYYDVCYFALYDNNDNMLDVVYLDHDRDFKALWSLPKGQYYLRYKSLDGYKKDITIKTSIIESGSTKYQIPNSCKRTIEEAPTIQLGEKKVMGANFWGYSQTYNENDFDGHFYKIKVAKKTPITLTLVSAGNVRVSLYDKYENEIGRAETWGTSTKEDKAVYNSPALSPGTYYVFVATDDYRAIGNLYYLTANYKYAPSSVKIKGSIKAGKKSFTAKWSKPTKTKLKNISGYQIRYSLKKTMGGAKTIKISKKGATSKTIKKLQGGKKYYVQIRSYHKVGKSMFYSNWSNKKSVKTKK